MEFSTNFFQIFYMCSKKPNKLNYYEFLYRKQFQKYFLIIQQLKKYNKFWDLDLQYRGFIASHPSTRPCVGHELRIFTFYSLKLKVIQEIIPVILFSVGLMIKMKSIFQNIFLKIHSVGTPGQVINNSSSRVLPKGKSFTTNSGTKPAVLPKCRSSTSNSGTKVAVLLRMNR